MLQKKEISKFEHIQSLLFKFLPIQQHIIRIIHELPMSMINNDIDINAQILIYSKFKFVSQFFKITR